jgi:fibronectin-binding autotransporter adhesin
MLSVSGGDLTIGGLLKLYTANAANSLALSGGGTISAGSLDLGGNFSRFTWTAGTLLISGSNGLNIDGGSTVGGSWTIGTGQNLTVNYSETVGSSTNGGAFTQTGGNHTVLGTLTIASGVGASGTYTLNGGVLSAAVVDNGNFTQNGGIFTGSLSINNNFNFTAGTFNGPLTIGLGANANFNGPFTTNSSVAITGNATVGAAATLNTTAGFDSEGGAMTLAGGTMAGSGPILNNGLISGFGVIGGSGGFTNNSTINQGAGNLTLANTGPSINNGAVSLASGRQLIVSAAYSNAGSITLNGAIISGTSTLINTPTGSLNGPGMISAPLSNSGNVIVDSGTLTVPSVFTNYGNIQLGGLTAAFNGSGIINANELQGFGTVGAPVTNNATIAAIGGTLTFSSPVNNAATGTLEVASGTKLLLSGGLAANNGLIGLSGGTVDSGTQYIVNSGQISGYGILSSGGLTNSAGATITLGGGTASIYGTLTNNVGGTVRVSQSTAVFQGPVINNGFMQVTGGNVTFAAGFTDNGIYSSDPSIHTLTNLTIGKAGALEADGDTFVISGNFLSSSTQSAVWDTRSALLEFSGTSVHAFSLTGSDEGAAAAGETNNFAWGTLQLDDNGTLSLQNGNANPSGALYVNVLDLADAPTDGTLSAYIADHLVNANAADPINVYYNPSEPGDAYLDDQTFALGSGGGYLSPLVPEPSSVMPLSFVAGAWLGRRRRTAQSAKKSSV